MLQRGLPRHATIICVRDNRAYDLLGVALLAQNLCSRGGMPLIGRVLVIGPSLVVEIVQQRSEPPGFFICAGFAGVGAHTRFHGEHVLAQTLRSGVFAQQFPGVLARRHAVLPNKEQIV